MRPLLFVCLLLGLTGLGLGAPVTKVVIDTDADFDDYLAMLYMIQNPKIKVVGIIVTGTGCGRLPVCGHNVADLMATLGRSDIPVIYGFTEPMRYSNVYPYSLQHCAVTKWGLNLTRSQVPISSMTPTEFLTKLLRAHGPNSVDLLSIGGATTFGMVDRSNATVLTVFNRSMIMGGNILKKYARDLGHGGNIPYAWPFDKEKNVFQSPYNNTVAEWNIFVDVVAANTMTQSKYMNPQFISLSACADVPLNYTLTERLKGVDTQAAQIAYQIMAGQCVAPTPQQVNLKFWDPLAAVSVAEPHLLTFEEYSVRVETELSWFGEDHSGEFIVGGPGTTRRHFAMAANGAGVFDEYIRILSIKK